MQHFHTSDQGAATWQVATQAITKCSPGQQFQRLQLIVLIDKINKHAQPEIGHKNCNIL